MNSSSRFAVLFSFIFAISCPVKAQTFYGGYSCDGTWEPDPTGRGVYCKKSQSRQSARTKVEPVLPPASFDTTPHKNLNELLSDEVEALTTDLPGKPDRKSNIGLEEDFVDTAKETSEQRIRRENLEQQVCQDMSALGGNAVSACHANQKALDQAVDRGVRNDGSNPLKNTSPPEKPQLRIGDGTVGHQWDADKYFEELKKSKPAQQNKLRIPDTKNNYLNTFSKPKPSEPPRLDASKLCDYVQSGMLKPVAKTPDCQRKQ